MTSGDTGRRDSPSANPTGESTCRNQFRSWLLLLEGNGLSGLSPNQGPTKKPTKLAVVTSLRPAAPSQGGHANLCLRAPGELGWPPRAPEAWPTPPPINLSCQRHLRAPQTAPSALSSAHVLCGVCSSMSAARVRRGRAAGQTHNSRCCIGRTGFTGARCPGGLMTLTAVAF